MKKAMTCLLMLACAMILCGCSSNPSSAPAQMQSVPADYGQVVDMAKAEFAVVFQHHENVQITETSTMARSDDVRKIVVQISYSSANGDGVYGFLFRLDDDGNPELITHGDNVTIDNLLK